MLDSGGRKRSYLATDGRDVRVSVGT